MENCLFCKIISGEIPSAKVFENDRVFAFKDLTPQAPLPCPGGSEKACGFCRGNRSAGQ